MTKHVVRMYNVLKNKETLRQNRNSVSSQVWSEEGLDCLCVSRSNSNSRCNSVEASNSLKSRFTLGWRRCACVVIAPVRLLTLVFISSICSAFASLTKLRNDSRKRCFSRRVTPPHNVASIKFSITISTVGFILIYTRMS